MNDSYKTIQQEISEQCSALSSTQIEECRELRARFRDQLASELAILSLRHRQERAALAEDQATLWSIYRKDRSKDAIQRALDSNRAIADATSAERAEQRNEAFRIKYSLNSRDSEAMHAELEDRIAFNVKNALRLAGQPRSALDTTINKLRQAIGKLGFAFVKHSEYDQVPGQVSNEEAENFEKFLNDASKASQEKE